jgi:hypothetical protein
MFVEDDYVVVVVVTSGQTPCTVAVSSSPQFI